MADPVTLATIATIGKAAAGAGALFSGISALKGGPKAPPAVQQPGVTPADREAAKRKGEDVQRRKDQSHTRNGNERFLL